MRYANAATAAAALLAQASQFAAGKLTDDEMLGWALTAARQTEGRTAEAGTDRAGALLAMASLFAAGNLTDDQMLDWARAAGQQAQSERTTP